MAIIVRTHIEPPSTAKIFTPGVIILLVLSVLGFILFLAAPGLSSNVFAISARGVLGGKIWQLVTYPFINDFPINLVFTGFLILFVGSAIERQWRTASFLVLWVVVSVVCGLLWVIITLVSGGNYIGAGASGCTYGLLATFGLLNRGKRLFFLIATVKTQYLVLILIAAGIILNIMQPIGLIWISGAPVAYLYVKFCWKISARNSAPYKKPDSERRGRFVDID